MFQSMSSVSIVFDWMSRVSMDVVSMHMISIGLDHCLNKTLRTFEYMWLVYIRYIIVAMAILGGGKYGCPAFQWMSSVSIAFNGCPVFQSMSSVSMDVQCARTPGPGPGLRVTQRSPAAGFVKGM